jgi:hypothetical protein
MKGYARTHPFHQKTKPENHGQTKGINNIFNKIITENFPNLEKAMPIQVQEESRTPARLDQNRIAHDILSLKQQAQGIEKKYWRL